MSPKKTILTLVKPLFGNRPFADRTLCHFLRKRLILKALNLSDLFDDFDEQAVTLRKIPRGSWSTPTQDIVMLLKLALCAKPKRILEIGSFRGYTALHLAQHAAFDAKVVTVDSYPDHGEAYRELPESNRIDRRVGKTAPALFANDKPGSFDLIFIDADHTYEGVRRDTELCLPLVACGGFIAWHDYANWGYFNGYNGVPEYLSELSARLPLAHIAGTDLAIHCAAWSISGNPSRARYLSAIGNPSQSEIGANPWTSASVR